MLKFEDLRHKRTLAPNWAYESLVNKTLDSLKKPLPYQGLYFDIHGAMSLSGLEDPEGDFIVRIRKVVGTKTIIPT